jgi:hypothetical protein
MTAGLCVDSNRGHPKCDVRYASRDLNKTRSGVTAELRVTVGEFLEALGAWNASPR